MASARFALARVSEATLIDELLRELRRSRLHTAQATIGGHVVETLGRVPEPGETVELDGASAEVTHVGEATAPGLRFASRADPNPESSD